MSATLRLRLSKREERMPRLCAPRSSEWMIRLVCSGKNTCNADIFFKPSKTLCRYLPAERLCARGYAFRSAANSTLQTNTRSSEPWNMHHILRWRLKKKTLTLRLAHCACKFDHFLSCTFPSRSDLSFSAWRLLFRSLRDIFRFVSLFFDIALLSLSHSLHAIRTSGGGGNNGVPFSPSPPMAPVPNPPLAAAAAAAATASAHPPCLVKPYRVKTKRPRIQEVC